MYLTTKFSISDECYIISKNFIQKGVVTGLDVVLGTSDDIEKYLHAVADGTDKPTTEEIVSYTVHVSPNLTFVLDGSEIYSSEYDAKQAIPVKNILF